MADIDPLLWRQDRRLADADWDRIKLLSLDVFDTLIGRSIGGQREVAIQVGAFGKLIPVVNEPNKDADILAYGFEGMFGYDFSGPNSIWVRGYYASGDSDASDDEFNERSPPGSSTECWRGTRRTCLRRGYSPTTKPGSRVSRT